MNNGLIRAVIHEQKRRKRGVRLNVVGDAVDGHAMLVDAPAVVKAKELKNSQTQQKEAEKRDKELQKDEKSKHREEVARQKAAARIQKQIERDSAQEAKEAAKAARQAAAEQKRQEKAAEKVKKAAERAERAEQARQHRIAVGAGKKNAPPLQAQIATPNRVSKPRKKAQKPASRRVNSKIKATSTPPGSAGVVPDVVVVVSDGEAEPPVVRNRRGRAIAPPARFLQ